MYHKIDRINPKVGRLYTLQFYVLKPDFESTTVQILIQ